MPQITGVRAYIVRKDGEKWCVYPKDGGDALGCHDTEDDANAQLRAIEAKKNSALFSLPNREVFATGTHNGDAYDRADLDDMVVAFKETGYLPPLKQGHTDEKGAPALGAIANLRRMGDKLVADFVDLTQDVYDAIVNRRFRSLSAEIYWDLERGGKTFRRFLSNVALLGWEMPAVANLKPVFAELKAVAWGSVKQYDLAGDEDEPVEVVEITRERMADVCPSCAEKMKRLNLKAIKIPVVEREGVRQFQVGLLPLPVRREVSACLEAGHLFVDLPVSDDQPVKPHAVKPATKEAPTMSDDIVKQLEAKLAEQKAAAEAQAKEANAKIAELQASQLASTLKAKLAEFILPRHREALAPIVRALMTPTPTMHTYTKDGKEQSILAVDLLRDECNRLVPKEFTVREVATGKVERPDGATFDDPRKEADARAKTYMAEKGQKDYGIALHAVLDADAELKQAYARV